MRTTGDTLKLTLTTLLQRIKHNNLIWPSLLVLSIAATYQLTRLNIPSSVSWRIQRAYDKKVGTYWCEPSDYNYDHSNLLTKEVKEFFLTADSLELTEYEQEVTKGDGCSYAKTLRVHKNKISNPAERAALLQAIVKSMRVTKARRVPFHYFADFLLTARKGKKRFKIAISIDGQDIKVERIVDAPQRDYLHTMLSHEAHMERVLFDGSKSLPLLQLLARQKPGSHIY